MAKQIPKYYDCEICGGIHPWEWDNDCRDDANRFTPEQLEAKHGSEGTGWICLTMDDRVAADNE